VVAAAILGVAVIGFLLVALIGKWCVRRDVRWLSEQNRAIQDSLTTEDKAFFKAHLG
jgi:hypothetical protein